MLGANVGFVPEHGPLVLSRGSKHCTMEPRSMTSPSTRGIGLERTHRTTDSTAYSNLRWHCFNVVVSKTWIMKIDDDVWAKTKDMLV